MSRRLNVDYVCPVCLEMQDLTEDSTVTLLLWFVPFICSILQASYWVWGASVCLAVSKLVVWKRTASNWFYYAVKDATLLLNETSYSNAHSIVPSLFSPSATRVSVCVRLIENIYCSMSWQSLTTPGL